MEEDSKEKILEDWNALKLAQSFTRFNDLRQYILVNALEQGTKRRIDTYKKLFFNSENKERGESMGRMANKMTTEIIKFRYRIKNLKKQQKSIDR